MNKSSRYISTRGGIEPIGFCDATMMGLAPDGGLLLPQAIPDVTDCLERWRALDYPALAIEVMSEFIGEDMPESVLRELVTKSYATFAHPDVVPVREVGPVHILELFHGPTLAFKDVALQFLGNLFEHILRQTGETLTILGATSGDTGSAAICGVRGKAGIEVFIMHPHGRVSPIQERQMTTVLDDNVHNIAIEGTFDDGQRVMKAIFGDLDFKARYRLGAVNSVNWTRVLAQVVYYFYGAFRVQDSTGASQVQVCVPTGNFGDIFAGYVAKRMGAPISRLVLATNSNDILARFFTAGRYELGSVHPTLSPSMDIQVASNFERYLFYRTGCDPQRVRELMAGFQASGTMCVDGDETDIVAGTGNDESTLAAIANYHRSHGYLLDPHTAVGVSVAEGFLTDTEPTLCLATAHPAKFKKAITDAVGADIARHRDIDKLAELPTHCAVLPATTDAVTGFIRETLAARNAD